MRTWRQPFQCLAIPTYLTEVLFVVPCPCFYPEEDPDTGACACDHELDEHDDTGQCHGVYEEL